MARSTELGDLVPTKKIKPKAKPVKTSSKARPVKTSSKARPVKTSSKAKPSSKSKVLNKIKKKKSSQALALIEAGKELKRQGERTVTVMQESVFDKNREQADQYASMFYQLIVIKDMAEQEYLASKSSRDIYALMKVYDQMREVIADMKALQDVGDYIDSMDSDVLRPYITNTAQVLLEFIRHTEQYCKKVLSEDDAAAIEKFVKRQGKLIGVKLNDAYRASLDNTRTILVG